MWKAPANDTIRGCLDVERGDHAERAGRAQPDRHQLHPAVRHPRHPDLGRPHAGQSTRDWRYINVRRLFNMVETTILRGHPVGGVRAERHDACGRASSARSTRSCAGCGAPARCSAQSADQAFYVKCDAETNPPESIDQGLLIVEVGIAPVKPAEFVVFRISPAQADRQLTSGTDSAAH